MVMETIGIASRVGAVRQTMSPSDTDELGVVLATLEAQPERSGVTHWSSPLCAELGLSNVTIAKVWKKVRGHPWRSETATRGRQTRVDSRASTC
jgi:hypothetical protein